MKPPGPVDVKQQRHLLAEAKKTAKAKAKGKAKATAKVKDAAKPKLDRYVMKAQKRNGMEVPTPYDRENKKQILQLTANAAPNPGETVQAWVKRLNDGEDVNKIIQESLQLKKTSLT